MKALGGAGPAPLLNEAAMDRVTLQTRNGGKGKGRQGGTGGMLFNNNFERAAKPVDGDVIAKMQQKRDWLLRCHLLVT